MLQVQNLKKSFGSKVVLNNLSFSIRYNSIYGLLGPNGAGKTTTINILCNLLDADAGKILMDGNNLFNKGRHHIGVVPQEISIYQDLTCKENLKFFAKIYGLKETEKTNRISRLINMFNLTEYENTRVNQLSGGWQRRINIAVALVNSPSLLIMDEPTAGLDVEARHDLWKLINTLITNGMSILLTTHQLEEAEQLCSRIGIMQNGHIIAEGTLEELRKLVPAKQLAIVETKDETTLYKKAESIGWKCIPYRGRMMLYLPKKNTLKDIINSLSGITLTSIALHDVGLEHVYMHVTG